MARGVWNDTPCVLLRTTESTESGSLYIRILMPCLPEAMKLQFIFDQLVQWSVDRSHLRASLLEEFSEEERVRLRRRVTRRAPLKK